MKPIIGIPRGMFFYKYYPFWQSFFDSLELETLVSPTTNKKILDWVVQACVDEACVPVKIFYGHVIAIKDKVDYLFIPRYTSVSRNEYICPKFGGLPDMIRNSLGDLPPIIDTEVNLRKNKSSSFQAALAIGGTFGKRRREITLAYDNALQAYRDFRWRVHQGELPSELIDRAEKVSSLRTMDQLRILVLGHVYNVYDKFLNMNLLQKIKLYGGKIHTLEMYDSRELRDCAQQLHKPMFWQYGTYALGCVNNLLQAHKFDGVIYLTSFGCGIDSFVEYMAERRIRSKSNIPFTILSLDEHSGEAGMDPRLEAFFDTIKWRNGHGRHLPTYGQFIR